MKKFFKLPFSLNPFSITLWLTIFVLILIIVGVPTLNMVELKTYDRRFQWKGVRKPSPEVVLAVIDEKSLDTEGRWPWPRSKIARLIESLSEDGAKVISFDIVFSEPDENTNLQLINQFDQKIEALQIENKTLNRFMEESKINADNDLTLSRAIQKSRAPGSN